MKKSEFLKDVMHEINMLKKHATKEELNKLDFTSFNPQNVEYCAYGQLTGSCESIRARELMDKSCITVVGSNFSRIIKDDQSQLKNLPDDAFSRYNSQDWVLDDELDRCYMYFSVLEIYIMKKDAKSKEILSYLKGETNVLEL